jgi:hypothetical protein
MTATATLGVKTREGSITDTAELEIVILVGNATDPLSPSWQ